jgi:hypothetical protein
MIKKIVATLAISAVLGSSALVANAAERVVSI